MSTLVDVINRHPDGVMAGASSVVLFCLVVATFIVGSERGARRAERAAPGRECASCSRRPESPAVADRTRVMPAVSVPPSDATAVLYRVRPVDERGRRG